MHRVFVYGTLKEGFRNFGVNRGRRLPGRFVTRDPYPLYVIHDFGLPWLVHAPGQGLRVAGQVFEVDDDGLVALDALERVHEPGWYTRRALTVQHEDDGTLLAVEAYFGDAARVVPGRWHHGPLAEYTAQHQDLYRRHLG
jgi:gamma-glutamylaminecyclotransferase